MQELEAADTAPRIIGYITQDSQLLPGAIKYSQLTHINYAFAEPRSDGSLFPPPNPNYLHAIVRAAHEHKVKVLISIGGWLGGDDSAFETLASKTESRVRFVNSVESMLQEFNLDGADIDWEYPNRGQSASNFLDLMIDLKNALAKNNKILSAAVISHGDFKGQGIPSGVFDVVDYLNIMAYDNDAEIGHSTIDFAFECIRYWLGRGLAPEKANLGVPFYGSPGWVPYKKLLAMGKSTGKKDLYKGGSFNGLDTIRQKAKIALENIGGIMIWELGYDSEGEGSLLKAAASVMLKNDKRNIH